MQAEIACIHAYMVPEFVRLFPCMCSHGGLQALRCSGISAERMPSGMGSLLRVWVLGHTRSFAFGLAFLRRYC